MRLRFIILGCALCGAAVVPGHAQARPPQPVVSCGQRGRVIFDAQSTLEDASGRPIARFSGGESAVTLLAPPADGSELVKIETGTGRGSFRLHGFVRASELRLHTAQNVPIVAGHVWFGPGVRVTLAPASGGKVKIEKRLAEPFEQVFSASAECSALTFAPPAPPASAAPASARTFLMKGAELELFGAVPPTGAPLFTLRRAPNVEQVRFASNEQRGGFVHVQYRGEVNVDAWARAGDLTPLPRGVTLDAPSSSYTLSSPPQLQLAAPPRAVKVTREIPLRVAGRDSEAPVGVIEPDTEVLIVDVIAGFAKVLPKSLHVLPVGEQSFWAKTSELGLPVDERRRSLSPEGVL